MEKIIVDQVDFLNAMRKLMGDAETDSRIQMFIITFVNPDDRENVISSIKDYTDSAKIARVICKKDMKEVA